MGRSDKIHPNDQCPCWSGKKYKRCCKGIIDWTEIIRSGVSYVPYMSIRGRNILFCSAVVDALGFDYSAESLSMKDYKGAFTASAVRKIYEAIYELWPPSTDIKTLLSRSGSDVSGLYIGDYTPQVLKRAVVRHSTYANKILLVDPFIHPYTMSDKYNPILEPAQYRAQTLKNVNLYRSLLPWIDAGIVEFIRTPADFDRELNWDAMRRATEMSKDPTIREALDASAKELTERRDKGSTFGMTILAMPDEYLLKRFEKSGLAAEGITAAGFIEYIKNRRDNDPDFLEPMGPENREQLHMMFAGGTYEVAKLTAQLSGSYLFTDLQARWALIEKDRAEHSAPNKAWSPFAKSVQNAKLNYLNNLDLNYALQLRKEGRLEGVRSVMTEAWKKSANDDAYDDTTAIHFAENLTQSVNEAEAEWLSIKSDVAKYVGSGTVTGLFATGPLIAAGHALWVAGAAVVGGLATAAHTGWKHASYLKKHPAAFFMKLRKEE